MVRSCLRTLRAGASQAHNHALSQIAGAAHRQALVGAEARLAFSAAYMSATLAWAQGDDATLARFPVLTKEIAGKVSVFVDVRTVTPPPAR